MKRNTLKVHLALLGRVSLLNNYYKKGNAKTEMTVKTDIMIQSRYLSSFLCERGWPTSKTSNITSTSNMVTVT